MNGLNFKNLASVVFVALLFVCFSACEKDDGIGDIRKKASSTVHTTSFTHEGDKDNLNMILGKLKEVGYISDFTFAGSGPMDFSSVTSMILEKENVPLDELEAACKELDTKLFEHYKALDAKLKDFDFQELCKNKKYAYVMFSIKANGVDFPLTVEVGVSKVFFDKDWATANVESLVQGIKWGSDKKSAVLTLKNGETLESVEMGRIGSDLIIEAKGGAIYYFSLLTTDSIELTKIKYEDNKVVITEGKDYIFKQ